MKMKNNKNYKDLISEGFSDKTLSSLSENQIKAIHSRVFSEATYRVDADNVDKIADKVDSDDTVEVREEEGQLNEWGSSDQTAFNRSIHTDLGEPTKMPSPFGSDLISAAESAVDFYWDDWEEYQTDYQGLVDNAKRYYLRAYFPREFAMLVKMFEPMDDTKEGDLEEEESYQKPLSAEKGWEKTVESDVVSDNRLSKTDGSLNNVKFVKDGGQAKEVSKSGHTGFAQPKEKANIGGAKKGNKNISGSVSESRTTKKDLIQYISEMVGKTIKVSESETESLPDFMSFDVFDGKVDTLVGNAPVETPVKPTTTPGIKPGKPIIKPKHKPKPKAQMEDENIEENGRTFAGGDETKGGLPKQRGSKHPKMKK